MSDLRERVTPRKARTITQFLRMKRDNISWRGYWMLVEDTRVSIAKQKIGYECGGIVSIPKRIFDVMVDWYNSGKWPPERKKQ